METNKTGYALNKLTQEAQIASQLNSMGLYRLKDLQSNILNAVVTYHNQLRRYEKLQVDLVHPYRNENFIIGIEVRIAQNSFHFRATFNYIQTEKQLLAHITYYSNHSEKPQQLQIEADNHTYDSNQLIEAMHNCLIEELKGNL